MHLLDPLLPLALRHAMPVEGGDVDDVALGSKNLTTLAAVMDDQCMQRQLPA